jgi:hypothetical protein
MVTLLIRAISLLVTQEEKEVLTKGIPSMVVFFECAIFLFDF